MNMGRGLLLMATALSAVAAFAWEYDEVDIVDSDPLAALIAGWQPAKPKAPRKVLYFSDCFGYNHHGGRCYGDWCFREAGKASGAWDLTQIKGEEVKKLGDAKFLAQFDAIVFCNSSGLEAKMAPGMEQALIDFVHGGKGVAIIHAGLDAFKDSPKLLELFGGRFRGHPWHGDGTWSILNEAPDDPVNAPFRANPATFTKVDEIYEFPEIFNRDTCKVLLSVDLTDPITKAGETWWKNRFGADSVRADHDYAVSWTRTPGKGRVFYTTFGHDRPAFLDRQRLYHMFAGLQYALGDGENAGCARVEKTEFKELPPLITNCEVRVNSQLTGKKAFYYCDDVIWLFRDLTRQHPKSLFDNPFLKILKEAHDRYGMKAQLNCFYRLDFFYGTDEFSLAEMTDRYRDEWQANKDWLKLGIHSLQEFPDYPFINADYKDMKAVVDKIAGEIARFAGPGMLAKGAVIHWGMISKDACRALSDSGIVMLCSHCGPRFAYNDDPAVLPYGHALRLTQNRKPETCLYRRLSEDKAINSSIGGYNQMTYDQANVIKGNFKYLYDRETKMGLKELEDFQVLAAGINLYTLAALLPAAEPYLNYEFFVWGNHEQYFYRDYLAYQPEYAAKILAMAKLLKERGYEHFFLEDLAAK